MMRKAREYVGIDDDLYGGMTTIGKLIRDAWVFGLLPEDEQCKGWDRSRLNIMLNRVNEEWDKYGCRVSALPEDLAKKHDRIYTEAIKRAKSAGWSGEREIGDES